MWQDKSFLCSESEWKDFCDEWNRMREHAKMHGENGVMDLLLWEERWAGACEMCDRLIPITKKRCPRCFNRDVTINV